MNAIPPRGLKAARAGAAGRAAAGASRPDNPPDAALAEAPVTAPDGSQDAAAPAGPRSRGAPPATGAASPAPEAVRIEVAVDGPEIGLAADPGAGDEPEGLPDPAVFAGFMPRGAIGDPAADAGPDGAAAGTAGAEPEAPVQPRPTHRAGRPGFDAASARPGGAPRPASDLPPHLAGIEVVLSVEVGQTRLPLAELLEVQPGQLFDLDRLVSEPVSILVNGRPFATGEILALGDRFGVRLLDLVDQPA